MLVKLSPAKSQWFYFLDALIHFLTQLSPFSLPPNCCKTEFLDSSPLDCVLRLCLCFIRRGAIKFSFSFFLYSTIFNQSFEERFVDKFFESEKKYRVSFFAMFFLTWPFSDFWSLEAIFKKLFFLDHISPEKASTLIQELLGFAVKIIFMKIFGFSLSFSFLTQ